MIPIILQDDLWTFSHSLYLLVLVRYSGCLQDMLTSHQQLRILSNSSKSLASSENWVRQKWLIGSTVPVAIRIRMKKARHVDNISDDVDTSDCLEEIQAQSMSTEGCPVFKLHGFWGLPQDLWGLSDIGSGFLTQFYPRFHFLRALEATEKAWNRSEIEIFRPLYNFQTNPSLP